MAGMFLAAYKSLFAQDTSGSNFIGKVYADVYYSYDFNKPHNHRKPLFLYNYTRHNKVNLNLDIIEVSYLSDKIRGNCGLVEGSYAQDNLATEPLLLQHVYEANAGVKIAKKANVWIDAGIFPSHISLESAFAKDGWTLTRSLSAENTPYYEAGAKLTYTTKDSKLLLIGLLLNGWQHIRRPNDNNTLAIGTQLTITPNEKMSINWSIFFGNDKPDSIKQMRYSNHFYGILPISGRLGIITGFDIGFEKKTPVSGKYNCWYTPILIPRFTPTNNWAFAAKGEYYHDKNSVLITTGTRNGFQTFDASVNINRNINNKVGWRTEIRTLKSKDAIFFKEGHFKITDTAITSSLAISF